MNTTIILTTHDMGDVDALCQRIIIIDKGKVLYDNDINHLKSFFGSYRNLVVRVDDELDDIINNLTPQYPDMSVTLNENSISLIVNEDNYNVIDVLNQLQHTHHISDFHLNEISSEDVIKKIYEGDAI